MKPKAAASRSKSESLNAEFVDMIRRIPKTAFARVMQHSALTVAEQRHLMRLFAEIK
jgi:hypothetical protein